jgi:hypothetical protein
MATMAVWLYFAIKNLVFNMKLIPVVIYAQQVAPDWNHKSEKSVRFCLIYIKNMLFLSVIQVVT